MSISLEYTDNSGCVVSVNEDELRLLAKSGKVNRDTLVRKKGGANWIRAGNIKGIVFPENPGKDDFDELEVIEQVSERPVAEVLQQEVDTSREYLAPTKIEKTGLVHSQAEFSLPGWRAVNKKLFRALLFINIGYLALFGLAGLIVLGSLPTPFDLIPLMIFVALMFVQVAIVGMEIHVFYFLNGVIELLVCIEQNTNHRGR